MPNSHVPPHSHPRQSLGPSESVQRILRHAAQFLKKHPGITELETAYGYFTHHPLAPLNKKRLQLILESVATKGKEQRHPLRILDLACGGGLITCAAAALGNRALGMDADPTEIHWAKLFVQQESLDGLFWQVDLLAHPDWENIAEETLGGKPELIILANALHQFQDAERFISRLASWLPSGTTLVINEENPQSPVFRFQHRLRSKDAPTQWHRALAEWRSILEARGFEVGPVQGADLVPGIERWKPDRAWSLVFTATKR